MGILFYTLVYVIGYFVSLVSLHRYKKELGIDCYDKPHTDDYDDWDSNAQAYACFSFVWFIFWSAVLCRFIYKKAIIFSMFIEKILKKYDTIKNDNAKDFEIEALKRQIKALEHEKNN